MISGWYYNEKNGQHFLSIAEIADACCVPPREVKAWFVDKIQKSEPTYSEVVDAADVVRFLVKNSIPVVTSLLPPKTRKILFISDDGYQIQDRCEKLDRICRFLSSNCNILVENSSPGRLADLSILTFSPHLVVICLKTYIQEIITTFSLLPNFPEQKTVFLVDDSIKNDVERDLRKHSQHLLVLSDSVPVDELFPQLRLVFGN